MSTCSGGLDGLYHRCKRIGNEHKLGSCLCRILLPPSERGPSAPVPSIVYENWAGVDMMYHLDGRWRRQSLVYFGEPQDLVI